MGRCSRSCIVILPVVGHDVCILLSFSLYMFLPALGCMETSGSGLAVLQQNVVAVLQGAQPCSDIRVWYTEPVRFN